MCLRPELRKKREQTERKERLAEKKSQEGTKRQEYHREVGILNIVFHKDNSKIWIGGYKGQILTTACKTEARSSQFALSLNFGEGAEGGERSRGWTKAQLINGVLTVSRRPSLSEKMWCLVCFTV